MPVKPRGNDLNGLWSTSLLTDASMTDDQQLILKPDKGWYAELECGEARRLLTFSWAVEGNKLVITNLRDEAAAKGSPEETITVTFVVERGIKSRLRLSGPISADLPIEFARTVTATGQLRRPKLTRSTKE